MYQMYQFHKTLLKVEKCNFPVGLFLVPMDNNQVSPVGLMSIRTLHVVTNAWQYALKIIIESQDIHKAEVKHIFYFFLNRVIEIASPKISVVNTISFHPNHPACHITTSCNTGLHFQKAYTHSGTSSSQCVYQIC